MDIVREPYKLGQLFHVHITVSGLYGLIGLHECSELRDVLDQNCHTHSVGQLVIKLSQSLYHSLALTMHRWLCTFQTHKLVNTSCHLLLPVATCQFL